MFTPHLETVVPSLFHKGPAVGYTRERLELADGDFLDLDKLENGNKRCMIISHGLEGDTNRYYVRRTADYFHKNGWDIYAWNCRSCSGEPNRLPRFYHHGETGDLDVIVQQALQSGYEEVVLFGCSMGGSMTLKYLGERTVDARIKGATVFSVPTNLRDSAETLKLKDNRFYERRFLKKLKEKMKLKSAVFPELIDISGIDMLDDFDVFHEWYTAPLHGFANGTEFFEETTCDRYMSEITVPVLLCNALNDPMLGEKCYPYEIAEASDYVFLETPLYGGHSGFSLWGKVHSWMELRAEEFYRTLGY